MISVQEVWAGYGGLDILRGVRLNVEQGSVNCVVGPNGAGKSTVLKTISGILSPRRGSIVIDGQELVGKPPAAILRAGVVQVPQRHGLFAKLTVRQNVMLGAYVIRRRGKDLHERYDQLAEMFPLLASRPHAPAGALSGGQRRMVEFARAMMLRPKVVLLDEPTLGLDPNSLAIIRDSILAIKNDGATILMVEQNVRFGLGLADYATVLNAGQVVLSGSAEDIRDNPNLLDVYFGAASDGPRTTAEEDIGA
ncbi:MAG TPA: ABC transporter ATP-binding protein [Pseudonocardiaceae bacterium]|jgi:branched-chain amino acid transport system ATP-binding protein|nr:ABC transporter ATP-binding protein [Pseudonocardiaceae bacterium]